MWVFRITCLWMFSLLFLSLKWNVKANQYTVWIDSSKSLSFSNVSFQHCWKDPLWISPWYACGQMALWAYLTLSGSLDLSPFQGTSTYYWLSCKWRCWCGFLDLKFYVSGSTTFGSIIKQVFNRFFLKELGILPSMTAKWSCLFPKPVACPACKLFFERWGRAIPV